MFCKSWVIRACQPMLQQLLLALVAPMCRVDVVADGTTIGHEHLASLSGLMTVRQLNMLPYWVLRPYAVAAS